MSGDLETRTEIIGTCGGTCPGDLVPVVSTGKGGAWEAEKCTVCNGRWWFQVPRFLGSIAEVAKAEARRREALKGAS